MGPVIVVDLEVTLIRKCKYKFATHDDESRSERSLELTQVSYSHDQIRLRRQVFMRT
uniref:Uncharacterized protein n=1 Tax=Triticum urartu TaxID=4572 RepID=A0A8R7UE62_TRIUA